MIKIKNISFLHFCILLYTMTTILSKVAAGYSFLSVGYILVFSAMIINLGVYAILWQQATIIYLEILLDEIKILLFIEYPSCL